MSGERPVELMAYEFLRARHAGEAELAHLLVRKLSRRDLLAFTQALAGVTLESLVEILRATGHADPEGWLRGLLERAVDDAVDRVAVQVDYRIDLDPPAA